jgi:MFS superfamily sulfate permease-like transporter
MALHLAATQLPKLLEFKNSHDDFWERINHVLSHLGETNPTSLALGAATLLLLILGKWLLPNRPVSLLVLVGGIAAVPFLGLADRAVALLGEVPQGLPAPGLPAVHVSDINLLLPLAMACFLLGAVETAAIGRMFARKHGYRLDSNQEFLALSAANLAAGLGHGFPVSGGMSQSLVNEGGGARTPLSGLVASGIVAVVALFLAGLLRDLPQPVLAAIVLMAVSGLFCPTSGGCGGSAAASSRWPSPRSSASSAPASCGVLIGVVIFLLLILRWGFRPRTMEFG